MPELERERMRGMRGLGVKALTSRLRKADREAAQRPDGIVANSTAVAERIRAFYGRSAQVIPPPVDVDSLDPSVQKDEGHFLWVHRLVDYKRPEVVLEAFRDLPYRLTMVGIGPLRSRLAADLPPNVELRDWVPRAELEELFARASGFIHVAEEDFGITIVEALGAGTPVIALNRGGATDIVRPDLDGLLIAEPTVEALRAAVTELASRSWDPKALADRAGTFSRENFLRRMSERVSQLLP
jgi:glycosyltransferase involved in cell wall biosynthesis